MSAAARSICTLMTAACLAACQSIPIASTRPNPPAELGTRTGKTLFAIYMVGSDLEGVGADDAQNQLNGSRNLSQLVRGYQGLTEAERANVDVIVAFGGSKRPGWEGIKIADMPTLIDDSKDGRFGNGTAYLLADKQGNMGDPPTLTAFLRGVKRRAAAQGAARIFVDLWDHGGGIGGFGSPGDPGFMNVVQIASAFHISDLKADIIGFDACLMACIEVASVLKPYGRYLVASEELEPGHGWDYQPLIRAMGTKAQDPTVELAKAAVDSLIDPADHKKSTGKTLSVLDLAKLSDVEQALARFARNLDNDLGQAFRSILKASLKCRFYGQSKATRRNTLDLVDYTRQVANRHPAAAPDADAVKAAVAAAVAYNREDGSRPNSHGLAVTALSSPTNFLPALYNSDSVPLPTWLSLTQNVRHLGLNDRHPPRIVDATVALHGGQEGIRLRVEDDKGVLATYGVHATQSGPGIPETAKGTRMAFILATLAQTVDDANDVYFVPFWDGQAFVLDFGDGKETIVPLVYADVLPNGLAIMGAHVFLNAQLSELLLVWSTQTKQGGILAIRPVIDFKGFKVPSRLEQPLRPGDTLIFPFATMESGLKKFQADIGPVFTITKPPVLRQKWITGESVTMGAVEEFDGQLYPTQGLIFDPADTPQHKAGKATHSATEGLRLDR